MAGSLSHNGLTGAGRVSDFATHKIEHELGGMFDVAHGAGLAAIWGSWARYVYKTNPGRFAQFGEKFSELIFPQPVILILQTLPFSQPSTPGKTGVTP